MPWPVDGGKSASRSGCSPPFPRDSFYSDTERSVDALQSACGLTAQNATTKRRRSAKITKKTDVSLLCVFAVLAVVIVPAVERVQMQPRRDEAPRRSRRRQSPFFFVVPRALRALAVPVAWSHDSGVCCVLLGCTHDAGIFSST